MSGQEISAEVLDFVREHIESHEQLQVLLLFHGACGRVWSLDAIAATLDISSAAVAESVLHLQRLGAVRPVGGAALMVTYQPSSPELARTIDRLSAAYVDNQLAVVKLLSSNALARVRSRAAHRFAHSHKRKPDA